MTMATGSPTHRTRSAGSGGCGATKNAEPSRLRSGTSWGLVGTGRCGMPASSRGLGPGEDGEHARHRLRVAHVDALDERVGVRRADERRIGLTRQGDVVAVAAAAGDQAAVLRAADGPADPLGGRVGARIEE